MIVINGFSAEYIFEKLQNLLGWTRWCLLFYSDLCLLLKDSLLNTSPTKYHCSLYRAMVQSVSFHQLLDILFRAVCISAMFQCCCNLFTLLLLVWPHLLWKKHLEFTCLSHNTFSVPSRVPAFKVTSIAATHVTLRWETIPLSEQNGAILYYQIGVDKKGNGKYQLFIHNMIHL